MNRCGRELFSFGRRMNSGLTLGDPFGNDYRIEPMRRNSDVQASELAGIRDTVESIWVAIVLAFVLRAFLIEAFVIPTGSMAPRLMGAHWQLRCSSCGRDYDYGVPKSREGAVSLSAVAGGARCPSCGLFHVHRSDIPPSRGDQVLVMKYLYHLGKPKPWDVVVFKNPQNNRENYIKRLIGLPGEDIEIVHGDIFVRNYAAGETEFRVRRKPPKAQEAMWQVVFDNDYQPSPAVHSAAPDGRRSFIPAWQPSRQTDASQWQLDLEGGRRFRFKGGRYAELALKLTWPPREGRSLEQSREIEEDIEDATRRMFRPHYGYNIQRGPGSEDAQIDQDVDIVSDLKLSVVLWPGESDGTLQLGLTSFGHQFRGDVSTDGKAVLMYRNPEITGGAWVQWGPMADLGRLSTGRGVAVELAYVDFRLSLRVDGREVLANTDRQQLATGGKLVLDDYAALHQLVRRVQQQQEAIPVPRVSIAAKGGALEVNHVRLDRDVYYTSPTISGDAEGSAPLLKYAQDVLDVSSGQPGWGTTGNPVRLRKAGEGEDPDLDEFFVLGDNSPQSHDCRQWRKASPTLRLFKTDDGQFVRTDSGKPVPQYKLGTVPRYNMLGKAFFVYWPAGYQLPVLTNLSLVPNVGDMRLIR